MFAKFQRACSSATVWDYEQPIVSHSPGPISACDGSWNPGPWAAQPQASPMEIHETWDTLHTSQLSSTIGLLEASFAWSRRAWSHDWLRQYYRYIWSFRWLRLTWKRQPRFSNSYTIFLSNGRSFTEFEPDRTEEVGSCQWPELLARLRVRSNRAKEKLLT